MELTQLILKRNKAIRRSLLISTILFLVALVLAVGTLSGCAATGSPQTNAVAPPPSPAFPVAQVDRLVILNSDRELNQLGWSDLGTLQPPAYVLTSTSGLACLVPRMVFGRTTPGDRVSCRWRRTLVKALVSQGDAAG